MSEKIIEPPVKKEEPTGEVPVDGGFAEDIQEKAVINPPKKRSKAPDNVYTDEDDFYSSKLNISGDKPLPPKSSPAPALKRSRSGILFAILLFTSLVALGTLYYLETAYYSGTFLHDALNQLVNFMNQTLKSLKK